MSILCLICKEKLLSYGPGGSLNQLVENVIISTSCGHVYHDECLQSWIRTQRIKKQNNIENSNVCPTCLTRVKEEDNRVIHLFEDHLEALEKAKMLERQENLEIYCHQLEIQLQQLQRENDMIVNKILTPPFSPSEKFDTIVKNDRVQWIRTNESPICGVVLSIFKKEGKLCAKLRLDRKIRTTQRSNRLFSSFRSEKKQEVTVPFDEIVLEKDVNENVSPRPREGQSPTSLTNINAYGRSVSSTNIFPIFSSPHGNASFRNSTLSLPGDQSRRLFEIKESVHESSSSINTEQQQISNSVSAKTQVSKPTIGRSNSYSPGFTIKSSDLSLNSHQTSATSSDASIDQQRDYVVITPPWIRNKIQIQNKQAELKNSSLDSKNKHVTFADDKCDQSSSVFRFEGVAWHNELANVQENSDTPYVNFPSPLSSQLNVSSNATESRSVKGPAIPPRPAVRIPKSTTVTNFKIAGYNREDSNSNSCSEASSLPTTPTLQPNEKLTEFPMPEIEDNSLIQNFGWLEDFDDTECSSDKSNSDCFGMTLMALLYCSDSMDQQMLVESREDSDFCRRVKLIVREKFIYPLRHFNEVQPDYAILLKESLVHLCSGTLDVEELLTILFEFTFKLSPFINYSLEMCDYLHQFFIDFMDKSKIRSVIELFEKSLLLQDNLKMEDSPSPALILQMPHSENGIIHYDAVIPNLTMVIDHLMEQGVSKPGKTCYCENEATLECRICSNIHGSNAILFCEKCKDLLQGIHKTNDHELVLSAVPTFKIAPTTMALSAIICWKNGRYYLFLKDGKETYSPWLYVHAIVDGNVQMKSLPGFGYWLESLDSKQLNVADIPMLLQKVLRYSRVFIYIPVRSSEV